jgi:hypothetical protein
MTLSSDRSLRAAFVPALSSIAAILDKRSQHAPSAQDRPGVLHVRPLAPESFRSRAHGPDRG